jgi:hypothetical protein
MSMRRTRGSTLLELTVVLALLGIALVALTDLAGAVRDRWAVEGARRAAAAAFHRTRAEAVARGGARLEVDTAGGILTLEAAGERRRISSLARDFGVSLRMGARPRRSFRYDPAGIGRIANATLVLRRGGAEGRLVVSLFGRVRP